MPDLKITKTPGVWSMACRVEVNIRARAETIWALLTDADGFPRWNSTVTAIDGQIRDGERLRIHVPGTTRTFTPRVAVVTPGRQMMWTGGLSLLFKGVRTFDLRACADDSTGFSMAERFSGLMLPLVRCSRSRRPDSRGLRRIFPPLPSGRRCTSGAPSRRSAGRWGS